MSLFSKEITDGAAKIAATSGWCILILEGFNITIVAPHPFGYWDVIYQNDNEKRE